MGWQRFRIRPVGASQRVRDETRLDELRAVEEPRYLLEVANRIVVSAFRDHLGCFVRLPAHTVVDGDVAPRDRPREEPLNNAVGFVRVGDGRAENAEQDQADRLVEVEGLGRPARIFSGSRTSASM